MSTANKVIDAMAQYSIKQVKPGEYKSNSPLRSGSDSMSFVIKIEDAEHGTYYDHVAREGGSLYQLAKILGIDTPIVAIASTKRKYDNPSDYAKAHGITWEQLKSAGWEEVTQYNRPALRFTTKTGLRYRFLDGKNPAFINQNGYKPCWYGLNERLRAKLEAGAPLVIANGEISTVTAKLYGLAVACVTSGEKDIPANLVNELKVFLADLPKTEILIALDCDTTGQRVALQIKDTLENAGFSSVKPLDLGLGKSGDLADFCMLHGQYPDSQKALLACTELKPAFKIEKIQRWKIVHASEMKDFPPIGWLINGEIPEKSLTVVYGGSGVGKSFWVLDKALKVAQNAPVVYMAAEGESGFPSRIEAWKRHNHDGVGKLYMCLGAVSFMDESDLTNFVSAIESACKAPSLVIVDTLARSMLGADENSTRDMGKFIDACEQIKHYFGCSVMLVHHTGKHGSAERGSSALRGAAEAMIKLTDDDDVVLVENSKTKDAKPFKPYYVKLLPVDVGVIDAEGNKVMTPVCVPSEKVVQTESDELTQYQWQVLEALGDVFEHGASPAELSQYLPDIIDRTMYRVLNSLKGFKFVEQSARRAPYVITDKGLLKIGKEITHTGAHVRPDMVTDTKENNTSSVSNGVVTVSNDSIGFSQEPLFESEVAENYYQGGH